MSKSPMQLSLELLRKRGWWVDIVERWVFKVRKDAFRFGDILAVEPGFTGAILLQTTTSDNMAARRKKILGLPEARAWLEAKNRIILHGWRKSKGVWIVKETEIF